MRRSYSDRGGGSEGGVSFGHHDNVGHGHGGRGGHHGEDGGRPDLDDPPHSRLFIIGGKTLSENEMREAFSEYGNVERVDVKREKGIAYVKFSKTSEAADALEAINGKTVGSDPRPLKVVIASSRAQQATNQGDITALRLFLMIPKTLTDVELRKQFEEFGPLEYVSIVKDKTTNASRGFGYVKYFQFSHAARAFECCDQSYKPKFADPRPSVDDRRGGGGPSGDYGYGGARGGGGGLVPVVENNVTNTAGSCRLAIMVSSVLSQDKLWKLFDIVPGLQHCELHSGDATGERSYGTVIYNTPKAAAYAIEKLNNFDFPLGSKVMIKYEEEVYGRGNAGSAGVNPSLPADVKTLVSTIQHATQLLRNSGYVPPEALGSLGVPVVEPGPAPPMPQMPSGPNLPPVQPKAPFGSDCVMRLFFVCKEARELPSPHMLNDVFSRFGNLIDAYLLKGKIFGYAKFASKESAMAAIEGLNGQNVMGTYLKVMEAEEPSSKRARVD